MNENETWNMNRGWLCFVKRVLPYLSISLLDTLWSAVDLSRNLSFLGRLRACRSDCSSCGISISKLWGNLINFFVASANVWVVFSEQVFNLFILSKFFSSVIDSCEEVPEFISEISDSTLSRVQSLQLVISHLSTSGLNSNVDKNGSDWDNLVDNQLETGFGHWNSWSFAVSDNAWSALEFA